MDLKEHYIVWGKKFKFLYNIDEVIIQTQKYIKKTFP